jgi:hypothetical protein
MQDKVNLKIDWASHEAAKYACLNWHYSKTIPVNKLVKIGVWENDKFIGVLIFGKGTSATLHKQFNLESTEVCELVRVALNNHINPVSKMMAIAIKFLKRGCPELKVIVSFADPSEGHHGGIYQATNWIYTGNSADTNEYFYNKSWRHATDVYKRLSSDKIKMLQKRKKTGKYRYVFPLNQEMYNIVIKQKKPYPKRMKQAMVDSIDTAKVQHLSIRSTELSEL